MNQIFPLTLVTALCLTAPASAQITSFKHVIVVVQENRTPDNLFQGLCAPPAPPSACSTHPSSLQYNIQTTAWLDNTSPTGTTTPHANPLGLGYDMGHSHASFVATCDLKNGACAMDGAALVRCDPKGQLQTCPAKPAFGYVDPSHVQPYLDLARAYGWGNYMFQTNQGASFPAHQYLFGATSAPSADDDHNGFFVADNGPRISGCIAAPTARVDLINPQGVVFTRVYPCFERQTLTDLLETAGVSWRYYGVGGDTWPDPRATGIWMAPNAIQHICGAVGQRCMGKEWTSHIELTPAAILSDATNCKLRGVSWVIPSGVNSDHSWGIPNTGGPSWVAAIVNKVGKSTCADSINGNQVTYWRDTAIIVTWDDWGGWYDHEPPPIRANQYAGYEMGFRVPLIVVSAYTPAGFISNTQEDFGSVARFIERNFGINEGKLTFADSRSFSDLSEFFSLGNPPRPFRAIKAPLSAKDFLTAKPSNIPPDDD
jgi:phospholipase C